MATELDYDLSTDHLATDVDPAVGNNFLFIILNLDRVLKPGVDPDYATEDDYLTNAQEVFKRYAKSATVPHLQIESKEQWWGNSRKKYAGRASWNDVTLTFADMLDESSKEYLEGWQRLCFNEKTKRVGRSKNYKKDCVLIEYSPDHIRVQSWYLKGCWISSLSEENFDMSSDGLRSVSVTLQIDEATPEHE